MSDWTTHTLSLLYLYYMLTIAIFCDVSLLVWYSELETLSIFSLQLLLYVYILYNYVIQMTLSSSIYFIIFTHFWYSHFFNFSIIEYELKSKVTFFQLNKKLLNLIVVLRQTCSRSHCVSRCFPGRPHLYFPKWNLLLCLFQ